MGIRFSVQADDPRMLGAVLESEADDVRFGSEYCESLLPTCAALAAARNSTLGSGMTFTYVTPRVSNSGLELVAEHLAMLSEYDETAVTANDYGVLQLLRRHSSLDKCVGRHLTRVPARSPWSEHYIEGEDSDSDRGKWVRALYSATSLNFGPTLGFLASLGCTRAELDWLPGVFPAMGELSRAGIRLVVHMDLVPVTFTRRCHTARFLGEVSPSSCSRPCLDRAFYLTNEGFRAIGLGLFLQGNAVLRQVEATRVDIRTVADAGVNELVLHAGPVTGLDTVEKIKRRISDLRGALAEASEQDASADS